jgi:hypothetical protein
MDSNGLNNIFLLNLYFIYIYTIKKNEGKTNKKKTGDVLSTSLDSEKSRRFCQHP